LTDLRCRILEAARAGRLVRVHADDAADMATFLGHVASDLESARGSCSAVATLFPEWRAVMEQLTAEIAAVEAVADLYMAFAEGGLCPARADERQEDQRHEDERHAGERAGERAGLAAFVAVSEGRAA
jgi:hypothetical protein